MREFERVYDDYGLCEAYDDGVASIDELFDPLFYDDMPLVDSRAIPADTVDYEKRIQSINRLTADDELSITNELLESDISGERVLEIKALLTVRNSRLAAWFVRQSMGMDGYKRDVVYVDEEGNQIKDHSTKAARGNFVSTLDVFSGADIDYDDRLQLAFVAMLKSIDSFRKNGSVDTKLSAKMVQFMEAFAYREYRELTAHSRIPVYRSAILTRIMRSVAVSLNNGTEPNVNQIAFYEPEVDANGVDFAMQRHYQFEKIYTEDYQGEYAGSLIDDYEGEPQEECLDYADFVADETAHLDFLQVDDDMLIGDIIDSIMESLTEKQQRIVEMRFGLVDENPRILEDIGEEFKLSRGRIHQIEVGILKNIRKGSIGARQFINSVFEHNDTHSSMRAVVPSVFGLDEKFDLFTLPILDRTPFNSTSVGESKYRKFIYQEDWTDYDDET